MRGKVARAQAGADHWYTRYQDEVKRYAQLEETCADALLEVERLTNTNLELRERIKQLEKPAPSGVQWSREVDYTREA